MELLIHPDRPGSPQPTPFDVDIRWVIEGTNAQLEGSLAHRLPHIGTWLPGSPTLLEVDHSRLKASLDVALDHSLAADQLDSLVTDLTTHFPAALQARPHGPISILLPARLRLKAKPPRPLAVHSCIHGQITVQQTDASAGESILTAGLLGALSARSGGPKDIPVLTHQESFVRPLTWMRPDLAAASRCLLTPAGRQVQATATWSLSAEAAAAWLRAPAEGTTHHFATFLSVSQAIQRFLRSWVRTTTLSDPNQLEDSPRTAALLFYSCGKVFATRSRLDFNYDVLSAASMQKYLRLAQSGVREEMRQISEVFYSLGNRTAFLRWHPENVLAWRRQAEQQTIFYNALQIETQIINALITFGATVSTTRRLSSALQRLIHVLEMRLYRFWRLGAFLSLAPAVFAEASWALKRALDEKQHPVQPQPETVADEESMTSDRAA